MSANEADHIEPAWSSACFSRKDGELLVRRFAKLDEEDRWLVDGGMRFRFVDGINVEILPLGRIYVGGTAEDGEYIEEVFVLGQEDCDGENAMKEIHLAHEQWKESVGTKVGVLLVTRRSPTQPKASEALVDQQPSGVLQSMEQKGGRIAQNKIRNFAVLSNSGDRYHAHTFTRINKIEEPYIPDGYEEDIGNGSGGGSFGQEFPSYLLEIRRATQRPRTSAGAAALAGIPGPRPNHSSADGKVAYTVTSLSIGPASSFQDYFIGALEHPPTPEARHVADRVAWSLSNPELGTNSICSRLSTPGYSLEVKAPKTFSTGQGLYVCIRRP